MLRGGGGDCESVANERSRACLRRFQIPLESLAVPIVHQREVRLLQQRRAPVVEEHWVVEVLLGEEVRLHEGAADRAVELCPVHAHAQAGVRVLIAICHGPVDLIGIENARRPEPSPEDPLP